MNEERKRFALIDDEEFVARSLERFMNIHFKNKIEVFSFTHPEEFLRKVDEGEFFHVVITDYRMPVINGVEVLKRVKEKNPDCIRIILTGYMDMQIAADAVNEVGIYKIILKPWKGEEIIKIIEECVILSELQELIEKTKNFETTSMSSISSKVEWLKRNRAFERISNSSNDVLKIAAITSLKSVIIALEIKDPHTAGHSFQVSKLTRLIAEISGYPQEKLNELEISALLHDIGKICIPESILYKNGRLNPEEFEIMKMHPVYGAKIVSGLIWPPMLQNVILEHHERYDGNGYPFGLKGEEVSIEGRIVALADSVSAMLSKRTYKDAKPFSCVVQEVKDNLKKQFDPYFGTKAIELLLDMGEENYRRRITVYEFSEKETGFYGEKNILFKG